MFDIAKKNMTDQILSWNAPWRNESFNMICKTQFHTI